MLDFIRCVENKVEEGSFGGGNAHDMRGFCARAQVVFPWGKNSYRIGRYSYRIGYTSYTPADRRIASSSPKMRTHTHKHKHTHTHTHTHTYVPVELMLIQYTHENPA